MSTSVLDRPDTDVTDKTDDGDSEHVAHIIWGNHPQAIILEAMVEGKVLTALCGKQWIPSRDTTGLPVCKPCLDEKKRIQGL